MWHMSSDQSLEKPGQQKSKLFNYIVLTALFMCGAIVLSGCSGSKKHAAFKGTGSPYYKGSGSIPKGGGIWKVGTPYKIAGKKYYPKENIHYDKVGIASWYGPKFHRRKTANGEWFNMHDLTAAHPTLPMPIFAKVTNLQNGRNIVVRINDRGPYAHKREIDLSKASAQALGVIGRGTAKVRVQYLGKAPLDGSLFADIPKSEQRTLLAKLDGHTQEQYAANKIQEDQSSDQASDGPTRHSQRKTAQATEHEEKIYVQAASFSSETHATNAKMRLSSTTTAADQEKVMIAKADIGGRTWYRLRMGPYNSTEEARSALLKIKTAGHRRAMIVSD